MMGVAKASNDAEVRIAADYFSKLKFRKWIRVVETDKVPKTEISSHNMLVEAASGGREPIGKRIIEVPENLERIELRDPRTGFVAYVPKGAVARGKKLVESGRRRLSLRRLSRPRLQRQWRGAGAGGTFAQRVGAPAS